MILSRLTSSKVKMPLHDPSSESFDGDLSMPRRHNLTSTTLVRIMWSGIMLKIALRKSNPAGQSLK
ncbi:hypothetical protein NL527_18880, partial [Klebsiella pneumoniae]|nr:hypothetical protein [Klebsiella pneumoniae]